MRSRLFTACVLALVPALAAAPSVRLAAQPFIVQPGQVVVQPQAVSPATAAQYPLDLASIGLTLPEVADDKMRRALTDTHTVFYKLEQAWQMNVPRRPDLWGVFRPTYLRDTNANLDFPWETTVGLNAVHRAGDRSFDTVNFLHLPVDDRGRVVPVGILYDDRPVRWIFPSGTTVGEILYVTHNGGKYVQEIRTRTKGDDSRAWFPGLFRPVKDFDHFKRLTGLEYTPARRYLFFRNPEEDEVARLDGFVERLPPLPEETVKRLLRLPFQRLVGTTPWSPAADQAFHILPKDYSFALLSVDTAGCATCHRQTQISVSRLIPREPQIRRFPTRVGNIRGSDTVFTWHPFHDSVVRGDVTDPPADQLYLRKHDRDNGLVQVPVGGVWPRPHPYRLTRIVQESLAGVELPAERFLHAEVKPSHYRLVHER